VALSFESETHALEGRTVLSMMVRLAALTALIFVGGTACIDGGPLDNSSFHTGDTAQPGIVYTGSLTPCGTTPGQGVYDAWEIPGNATVELDVVAGKSWDPAFYFIDDSVGSNGEPYSTYGMDDHSPCTITPPNGGSCGAVNLWEDEEQTLVVGTSSKPEACSSTGRVRYTLTVSHATTDEATLMADNMPWPASWTDALCGSWYPDADGDGYGIGDPITTCDPTPDMVIEGGDCAPYNAYIHPGAWEECNGLDDDCDGQLGFSEIYVWSDDDGDGYGGGSTIGICEWNVEDHHVGNGDDCDDSDPTVRPNADDVCNGVDDDCSGAIDDNPFFMTAWYLDGDGDSYGAGPAMAISCESPAGMTSNNSDCNDSRGDAYPGATEVCDGVDLDCDGLPNSPFNDAYEPNSDRASAALLSYDNASVDVIGKLPDLDGSDWYAMATIDDWDIIGDLFEVRFTVDNLSPGLVLNVRLYKGTSLLYEALNTTGPISDVYWGGNHWSGGTYVAVDDSGTYYVEVEVVSGASCGVGYHFSMSNSG
jgi:hypothetical protein